MSNRGLPPGNRGRFLNPMGGQPGQPPQYQQPVVSRNYPENRMPPQQRPALPPESMGDPGYGMRPVSGADLRRALEGMERRMQEQFESLRGETSERIDEMFKLQSPGFGLSGLNKNELQGLGQEVKAAISQGRCIPYMLTTDVAFEAGSVGDRRFGGIILTTDGPFFIVRMLAYAQIDDVRAENFPFSLIDAPPCDEEVPCPNGENRGTSFDISCSTLIPQINANGMFIPVSPRNCHLICCDTEVCCATQTCEVGELEPITKNFSARVPIVLLDHPECVDGVTEISLNGCQFDNIPFPLAFWEDAMFNVAQDAPDCVGVCGFLDCQKQLDIALTLTRPLRYDVDVFFVLAGFRILTCGPGFCAT